MLWLPQNRFQSLCDYLVSHVYCAGGLELTLFVRVQAKSSYLDDTLLYKVIDESWIYEIRACDRVVAGLVSHSDAEDTARWITHARLVHDGEDHIWGFNSVDGHSVRTIEAYCNTCTAVGDVENREAIVALERRRFGVVEICFSITARDIWCIHPDVAAPSIKHQCIFLWRRANFDLDKELPYGIVIWQQS